MKEIEKRLFTEQNAELEWLEALKKDSRKGVHQLLQKYERQQRKQALTEQMHEDMKAYEGALWAAGHDAVAGLDEVGRGPLAGPVVAAAVILPKNVRLLGLTDSKKLSKEKREAYYEQIKEQALAYSVAVVHADEIDKLNIYQATKKAMLEAIHTLPLKPDALLLDAMELPIHLPQQSIIKGDQKSLTIAASSVLAKVTRDRYMENLENRYPGYGFARHVGYGTQMHLDAIERLGLTPEHRRSFRPVREVESQTESGAS
ncbi:ribonuclease HII [Halalkalibacterium ligniniphilum]|uniref:ribonuclease HII n=1 Tax=Halalkalibacterium ligniniphilum TaxID=1134413 RepID=UPI000553C224|nr:ribonuclease HII [Halalkalibacterium ligniniphilum]